MEDKNIGFFGIVILVIGGMVIYGIINVLTSQIVKNKYIKYFINTIISIIVYSFIIHLINTTSLSESFGMSFLGILIMQLMILFG